MLKYYGTLLILLLLTSCNSNTANKEESKVVDYGQPNILMIVVDDLRLDELSIMNHPFLETPNIDRLAKEGVLFTNAYQAVPLCSPNRASILTGQYPSRHGIFDNVAAEKPSHKP